MKVLLLAAALCLAAADDDFSAPPVRRPTVPVAVHAPASSYTAYPTARRPAVRYGVPQRPRYDGPSHAQRGYASEYQQPRYYQPRPYSFAYGVDDRYDSGTVFSRSEESDGVTTRGRYSVNLPDGCVQTVTYWADHTGYHPTVKYECAQKRRPAPVGYYGYGAPVYRAVGVPQTRQSLNDDRDD
ncbi:Pro-resilin [Amphibalanus amphitrite]|uniref:Pro-resilin n=1 Tax=Amphibalanus amphitrite TaxID=1232801 RepID=A0A6A4WBA6_AMPAM|nr:Pro-resilin [Amphibalanus amphitrite]